MDDHPWIEHVYEILNAIEELNIFISGMDLAAFCDDQKTVRAVELDFIIIGDAASYIPAEARQAHPSIPWEAMSALRTRLQADYSLDPMMVWEIIQNDLPPITAALKELAEQ